MEKVYLLLRQNIQSGPYTLDELGHLHLQPTDLIWIEGESKSWNTPAILGDEPRNEFRGPDTNDWISPRGDEGRRAPAEKNAQASLAIEAPRVASSLSGSYRDPEDIELIVHKKGGATVSLVQLLGVAAVTALLALAWDNRFKLVQTQEDAISYASAPVVFVPRIPGQLPKPVATTVIDSSQELSDQSRNDIQKGVKTKKTKPKSSGARTSTPVLPVLVENPEGPEMNEGIRSGESAPAETKIIDTPVIATQEGLEREERGKRKTLGQAIKGLFKKKNKEGRKNEEKVDQE